MVVWARQIFALSFKNPKWYISLARFLLTAQCNFPPSEEHSPAANIMHFLYCNTSQQNKPDLCEDKSGSKKQMIETDEASN